MVYTDEHGYERWRRLSYEERVGQNRWEELLEYTDAFEYWYRIRVEICNSVYIDCKERGVYYRKFKEGIISYIESEKSKNPDIKLRLNQMAPFSNPGRLNRKGKRYNVAFAVEEGLVADSNVNPSLCLVQIDPSIKAEEAMACIAAQSLETYIDGIGPVDSPLKRLVHRIENGVERKPLCANFNAQRCKDEFEKLPYTQLTIYITCTDDQALARLKERVPAYEVVVVEEYGGRRVLKLAVPRLGLGEEVPGPLRWRYDGVRLY
jgi:hypothetical protein